MAKLTNNRRVDKWLFSIFVFCISNNTYILNAQSWLSTSRTADSLQKAGNLKDAIPLSEQLVAEITNAFGEADTATATEQGRLGFLYLATGRLDKAELLLRASLKTKLTHFPATENRVQMVQRNLGMALANQGKMVQAEQVFDENYRALTSGNSSKDTANWRKSVRRLAGVKAQVGKLTEAEALFEEGWSLYQNTAFDSLECALFLSDWGMVAFEAGRYQEAETRLRACRDIQLRNLGRNSEPFATSQSNLAALYGELGDYDSAIGCQTEAFEFFQASPNFGKNSPKTYYHLFELASLSNGAGLWKEAEKIIEINLPLFEATAGKENKTWLKGRAELLFSRQRLEKLDSLALIARENDQVASKVYGEKSKPYFLHLANLACVLEMVGDLPGAEDAYRRHLALMKHTFLATHPDQIASAVSLANFLGRNGKGEEAEALFESYMPLLLENLRKNAMGFSEKQLLGAIGRAQKRYFAWLDFVRSHPEKQEKLAGKLLNFRLELRALAFSNGQKLRDQMAENPDPDLKKKFDEWVALREELAKSYLLTQSDIEKQGILISSMEENANFLETDIVRKVPLIADLLKKEKADWRLIQQKLGPEDALVEVVKSMRQDLKTGAEGRVVYTFFVLTKETTAAPKMLVLKNGEQLEGLLRRQFLVEIFDTARQPTSQAFEHFWSQLNEFLVGKKVVWYCPDGVYAELNPLAFRLPDGRFLYETTDIRTIGHPNDLLQVSENKQNKGHRTALIMGNPAFDLLQTVPNTIKKGSRRGACVDFMPNLSELFEKEDFNFDPLPFAGEEAKKVASILGRAGWETELLIEKLATETKLKFAQRPEIVHLATHSFSILGNDQKLLHPGKSQIQRDPIASSMLFFAGAKQGISMGGKLEDDGVFTGIEAANLDLYGTDLVVLSACETGRGLPRSGEQSLIGLPRAFRIAGAASVLVTLWRVDDAVTSEFMPAFYEKWLNGGTTKREALRQTQKEFAQKHPSPAFWAPFIIIGE